MIDQNYISGNGSDNDVQVRGINGSILYGQDGNDILRGGKYNDILDGGRGDDQMFGGDGADQFRFFGNYIEGTSDLDKIYDLDFSEGDTLVLGEYGALGLTSGDGINVFNGGNSAIISSFEGIAALVESSLVTASQKGNTGVLILTMDNGAGGTQIIHITGGWAEYVAASSN